MPTMSRRAVLGGMVALAAAAPALADDLTEISSLVPGDFAWHPERQPAGPVAVIVSIPQQLVHVYRNGIRIGVSTCSTGKKGHRTPTGVFVILQKDKHHHSSTYNNAPMPNMNRLTWSGIALHAGQLPGYPASHGCVRLPMKFSEDLFSVTHLGTPVIIAGDDDPRDLTNPGLILGGYADSALLDAVNSQKPAAMPPDWKVLANELQVSVVASSADRKIMLLIDETVVAVSDLQINGQGPLGDHVLVLQGPGDRLQWGTIARMRDDTAAANPVSLMGRLSADPDFADLMSRHQQAGMVAVLTDLPLQPDMRTGSDFVIMNGRDA